MTMSFLRRAALSTACLLALAQSASAQAVAGLWDAVVVANKVEVPFQLEIAVTGTQAQGFFFDGDRRIGSTSGSFRGGMLKLDYDFLNTTLEATLTGDELHGTYGADRPGARRMEFRAAPFKPAAATAGDVPQLAGSWLMYHTAPDGSKLDVSWRLYLRQSAGEFSGAILKTSGDTGTLVGRWSNGRLTMSHFAGERPLVFEAQPNADGTLAITLDHGPTYIAAKTNEAVAKGIPAPPDLSRFTSVRNPEEPFHFSGVALDGRTISDADSTFRGKVVVLTLGGTWCPNCHDEAPSLVEMYRQYHARGLEVVGLFLENDPQIDATRPRITSFVRRYAVPFPIVVAGGRDDGPSKFPQLVNFSVYPTTVILGRDGRVRNVHAGFASLATGDEHTRLETERRELVERLLAEPAPAGKVSASAR